MGSDVDAFLLRLAQELRPREDRAAGTLLQRLRNDLPELWKYDGLAAMAVNETAVHVSTFLDVLENRADVTRVQAPPEALEVARRFAQGGVPLSSLLRAYRLGHMCLLQFILGEATRLTDDLELFNAAATRLVAAAFEYVDRGSEQVVATYQLERDRRVQRRLVVTNEASRRIGTTLDMTRTAQELADVGTDDFADLVAVDLLDFLLHPDAHTPAPPTAPPLLRRVAELSSRDSGAAGTVGRGRTHSYPPGSEPARALATGQARVYRTRASDPPACWEPAPEGGEAADDPDFRSVLLLPLRARGDTLGLAQFFRHRTAAPFDEDDLLLAQEMAGRAAVHIDNARRYTRERSTALTLQRSLLPQRPAEQSAVVAASRYLPSGSRAGVGGDWYDVIPLSGARVALVVGDVVGRGLHASATMGRLRTAVRAYADIDLMPDELLTHLDDVVIRLQREGTRGDGELGATCLYMVYDPVSRMCSLASAGHVLPAVASPRSVRGDGPAPRTVDFPDLPIGPPLGLGGLPFETAQFEVPEGSLLTLYTDGLLQGHTRDMDTARVVLRDILTGASDVPDEICDRLLAALLPSRPSDDVALLVARTRALDPDHVATLDLPSDPAAVAGARVYTSETLAAWELEELTFGTELIISELVTNAIRYGEGPIHLRLILQSTLTCEVFDAAGTAPHLRRARSLDEGGRGLMLVARLSDRWGTRYSREGKVIWAEQSLSADGSRPSRS
ncbi:SpoIIE family protein phosphatase [Streptomyces sp. MUM 136J]|uniref:ATP-binding SpoIIE family protein phosphatase n=1 Tax=Streptomyces sp. MUM 136J TaxID=2791992 RepID=UPI001F04873B|nr:SpoIIE family protein phosphatase [Streptomyces sp. MUM 136J]MCH0572043.1 SpoIIE family protein phosphatase [Streptomyces sp. MUM 136J]